MPEPGQELILEGFYSQNIQSEKEIMVVGELTIGVEEEGSAKISGGKNHTYLASNIDRPQHRRGDEG